MVFFGFLQAVDTGEMDGRPAILAVKGRDVFLPDLAAGYLFQLLFAQLFHDTLLLSKQAQLLLPFVGEGQRDRGFRDRSGAVARGIRKPGFLRRQDGRKFLPPPKRHRRHTLGIPCCFKRQNGGIHDQGASVAHGHEEVFFLRQMYQTHQRALVRIGTHQLLPVRFGAVGLQGDMRELAVGKGQDQAAAVVVRVDHVEDRLSLVHTQKGREETAQEGGLGRLDVAEAQTVDLLAVGEEEKLVMVRALEAPPEAVAFLVLLLGGHAEGLGRDLLEVALFREEDRDRVRVRRLLFGEFRQLILIHDARAARGREVFVDLLKLGDQDGAQAPAAVQGGLEVRDVLLQGVNLGGAFEDILAVDVPQADLRHVLGLLLVDAEAHHQVRHHVGLQLGVADDLDGAVDVQEDGEVRRDDRFLLHAEQAVQADSTHPLAWGIRANVHFYAPRLMGGNKQLAMREYERADSLFELHAHDHEFDWTYMAQTVSLVQCYDKLGLKDKALAKARQAAARWQRFDYMKQYLQKLEKKNK